jgi:hypothetical protein
MSKLYELSLSKMDPKGTESKNLRVFHSFPKGTHNDAPLQPNYFSHIKEFLESNF